MKAKSPERQLDGFIDKYTPEIATFARAVLAKMRAWLPGAKSVSAKQRPRRPAN